MSEPIQCETCDGQGRRYVPCPVCSVRAPTGPCGCLGKKWVWAACEAGCRDGYFLPVEVFAAVTSRRLTLFQISLLMLVGTAVLLAIAPGLFCGLAAASVGWVVLGEVLMPRDPDRRRSSLAGSFVSCDRCDGRRKRFVACPKCRGQGMGMGWTCERCVGKKHVFEPCDSCGSHGRFLAAPFFDARRRWTRLGLLSLAIATGAIVVSAVLHGAFWGAAFVTLVNAFAAMQTYGHTFQRFFSSESIPGQKAEPAFRFSAT